MAAVSWPEGTSHPSQRPCVEVCLFDFAFRVIGPQLIQKTRNSDLENCYAPDG